MTKEDRLKKQIDSQKNDIRTLKLRVEAVQEHRRREDEKYKELLRKYTALKKEFKRMFDLYFD